MTILICESLPENSAIIRDLLARTPAWSILESNSAESALRTLAENDVRVVLTDLDVREASGKSLIEALRSQYPHIPTVVITPAGANKAVVQALLLGAASYIPRTALARDLVGTIERLSALTDSRPAWEQVSAHWVGATSRFLLPNDQHTAQQVIHHLQDELWRYQICGPDQRTRIGMALTEALANAIIHGNLEIPSTWREDEPQRFERELAQRPTLPPYRGRTVQLTATYDASAAAFVITDQGPGFDLRTIPDPTDEENLMKVSGRGLLLMRAFTDRLSFNDVGNEVRMEIRGKPYAGSAQP